ncbi:MAG TPA: helix-turn-helix transcriptional regulator [Opitutaceae bacterium]
MVPDLPDAFGKVLSELRERKGWSQMTLAMKAGLHLNAVSNLERGKRSPSLYTVLLLSRALDVPASKLVAAVEKRLGQEHDRAE